MGLAPAIANVMQPDAIYRARRDARRRDAAQLQRRDDHLSNLRTAAFLSGLGLLGLATVIPALRGLPLLLPFVAFVILALAHERVIGRRRLAQRAAGIYEEHLAKLAGTAPPGTPDGSRHTPAAHPYARDLDIVGPDSLFVYLNETRTHTGCASLAHRLLNPLPREEIEATQEAVRELSGRLDLREDLALLGGPSFTKTASQKRTFRHVHPDLLRRWAAAPAQLRARWVHPTVTALTAYNIAFALAWPLWGVPPLFFGGGLLATWVVGRVLRDRVAAVGATLGEASDELTLLAQVARRLEREPFASPVLLRLQHGLRLNKRTASQAISRLTFLVAMQQSSRNQLFWPLAFLLLWDVHVARACDAWRLALGDNLEGWLGGIGEIEALASLGSYAFDNPDHIYPEVVATATAGPCLHGSALGHPLLPRASCVANDVHLDENLRVLIVSGSNMSGKSTLLRTVGINVVLALAGAPVRATAMRLTPLSTGATLRVQDSLQQGDSRFFAEIKKLKGLLQTGTPEAPLLFLLDEILHGTNSHDRRIGATAVVRELLRRDGIGLVTTHDLALADAAGALGAAAANVHFADSVDGDTLHFDYRMRPGVVQKSNAIALMRAIGLDVGGPVDS